MKHTKLMAIGTLLLLGVSGAAAQSLGDYARAARKKKPESTSTTRHYDNDNLPTNETLSVVGPPPPAPANAGQGAANASSTAATKASRNRRSIPLTVSSISTSANIACVRLPFMAMRAPACATPPSMIRTTRSTRAMSMANRKRLLPPNRNSTRCRSRRARPELSRRTRTKTTPTTRNKSLLVEWSDGRPALHHVTHRAVPIRSRICRA